jgi:hypothetical protein
MEGKYEAGPLTFSVEVMEGFLFKQWGMRSGCGDFKLSVLQSDTSPHKSQAGGLFLTCDNPTSPKRPALVHFTASGHKP